MMSMPPPGYGSPQQPPPYGHHPNPYPPAPARRWWHHPALVITALVVFPPGGIALAWTSRWGKGQKIVATVLAGLWFLAPFFGDPPEKAEADAKPKPVASRSASASPTPSPTPSPSEAPNYIGRNLKQAKAAAYKVGYETVSHDASDADAGQGDDDNWKICFQTLADEKAGTTPTLDFGVVRNEDPCPAKDGEPIPYPNMPKVVGQTFATASDTLKPLSLRRIEARSAYTDVSLPASVDDWTVCFQEPEAGEKVQHSTTTTAYLKVIAPGTKCPSTPDTELHPKPAPSPDEDTSDTSDDSSSGGSSSGGSSSGGSSSTGGGGSGSVYYKNCTAVRAANADPIHRGDPGYGRHLDRDGDGVGCE
jgi:hypothetical protein